MAACSSPRSEATRAAAPPERASIEQRVQVIQANAKRIDAATAGRRLTKDLQHWQLSGTLEGSEALSLMAIFSEGGTVRSETYYFLQGKPVLLRAESWWDTDTPPEPAKRQEFYIENDRIIRHVVKVESSPPVVRSNDTAFPAAVLTERARSMLKVLLGESTRDTMRPLEVFPEVSIHREPSAEASVFECLSRDRFWAATCLALAEEFDL